MKIVKASLEGVLVIETDSFGDSRGFFMEIYHEKRYVESGIKFLFVQDNLSFSTRGTLRGLHYQQPCAQAKLVQAIKGEIYDVAVDIRRSSKSFGKWSGFNLSDKNKRQVYIPEGFAHGFCVLSETALVMYKCTDFYAPDNEVGILWCDPKLGIEWPVSEPLLSTKGSKYPLLKDISSRRLPEYINPEIK